MLRCVVANHVPSAGSRLSESCFSANKCRADFPALCVVLLFCSVGETVFFVHGAHVGVNPSTTEFSDNVFQCFTFFLCVCFFFPINWKEWSWRNYLQNSDFAVCLFSVRRVPPRFSIPPTDNDIMPGGSVNITCVAVGSPMPYVKWMLGAEDLTPEDDMPIGRNVLELTDVRQSANYTCVAMSTLGVIEAMAQITVKGEGAFLCVAMWY